MNLPNMPITANFRDSNYYQQDFMFYVNTMKNKTAINTFKNVYSYNLIYLPICVRLIYYIMFTRFKEMTDNLAVSLLILIFSFFFLSFCTLFVKENN